MNLSKCFVVIYLCGLWDPGNMKSWVLAAVHMRGMLCFDAFSWNMFFWGCFLWLLWITLADLHHRAFGRRHFQVFHIWNKSLYSVALSFSLSSWPFSSLLCSDSLLLHKTSLVIPSLILSPLTSLHSPSRLFVRVHTVSFVPWRWRLFPLFSTSWLLSVMWGMCYVISRLKCALTRSPFPCCDRWIIYVNYSTERYALSTTEDLSVDLFLFHVCVCIPSLSSVTFSLPCQLMLCCIWNLPCSISCTGI